MDIVIDIGNSLYKAYLFDNEQCVADYASENAADFLDYIHNIMTKHNLPKRICLSSVRKEDDIVFKQVTQKYDCTVLSLDLKFPVEIDYQTIDTLGKDRIANVCGAVKLFPGKDILVVDAGTAITIDFIEKGRKYIGGNISPGIKIRYKALNTFTGNLPLLDIDYDRNIFIGKNTEEAIIAGVQNGVLFEVEMYLKKISRLYPDSIVIFTGGDAIFFANSIKNGIFVEKKLTAYGLLNILELNA